MEKINLVKESPNKVYLRCGYLCIADAMKMVDTDRSATLESVDRAIEHISLVKRRILREWAATTGPGAQGENT